MNNEPLTQTMNAQELLGVLRRHLLGMFLIVVLCIGGGLFLYKRSKPMFRSSTDILVEGKTASGGGTDISDPVTQVSMPNPDTDLPTQMEVLQSAKLLSEAFNEVGVVDYNSPNRLQTAASYPKVSVIPVGTTSVLALSVDSVDPVLAQRLANVIPVVYLNYVRQNRQAEVDNAIGFLSAKLTAEQDALHHAELELDAFKKQNTLLPTDDEGSQRASTARTAEDNVHKAEGDVVNAQKRLDALTQERGNLPQTLKNPSTNSNWGELQTLRDKLADLKGQRESLLLQYLPDNPEVQKIDAEIATAERHLSNTPKIADNSSKYLDPQIMEFDSKVSEARVTLQAAKATLNKYQTFLDQARTQLKHYSDLAPRENELQRSVADRKSSVEAIGRAIDVLRVRRNAAKDPVTVLAAASNPEKVKPVAGQFLGSAAMLGVLLGIGFAFGKDRFEDRLTSVEQAFDIAGAQPLGHIPALPNKESSALVVGNQGTVLESYRMLRFNLLFSTLKEPIKSLVITSTVQGEGKSLLATNLAYAMAVDGLRVILVDGDLRRPTIHKKLNLPDSPGLAEVLSGKASLSEALHETLDSRLQVLTAGAPVYAPADLLNSPAMKVLHDQLKDRADCVIIDAPATLAGADAQVLGSLADSVLYVAQLGETRKAAMHTGIEMLRKAQARILGVVFSNADGKFGQIPYVVREA